MKLRALCLVLLLGLCARPVVASPIVSLDPISTTIAAGSSFFLDIDISDVSDLITYQFDLSYDTALLKATEVIEGSFLSSAGETFFIPGDLSVPGSVTFTAGTLTGPDAIAKGDGILARINFTALAAGISDVNLSNVFLQDSTFALVESSTRDASVMVTAVPEPTSGLLLATGLVATWRARRRLTRA